MKGVSTASARQDGTRVISCDEVAKAYGAGLITPFYPLANARSRATAATAATAATYDAAVRHAALYVGQVEGVQGEVTTVLAPKVPAVSGGVGAVTRQAAVDGQADVVFGARRPSHGPPVGGLVFPWQRMCEDADVLLVCTPQPVPLLTFHITIAGGRTALGLG